MLSNDARIAYVHQPNFMPYLGVIEGMLLCDVFVIFDDVQFEKGGWQNRNKLKSSRGPIWITVPVRNPRGRYISEVEISQEYRPARVLRTIEQSYSRAPYFLIYFSAIATMLTSGQCRLIDLNVSLLEFLRSTLEMKCTFVKSSDLLREGYTRTERLIGICKQTCCGAYYSGSGGKSYIDRSLFEHNHIAIVWSEFEARHPIYRQQFPSLRFIPFMGCLDMLFNCGSDYMREALTMSGHQRLAGSGDWKPPSSITVGGAAPSAAQPTDSGSLAASSNRN